MSDVIVRFKDGDEKVFVDRGAPGGSYSNKVLYEGEFVIVEDPYGNKTAYPAEEIKEVYHESERRH